MQVRDVMTPTVVTVREDTPFKQVVETLLDHSVSGVPVVDPGGFVVGIVTEADLISKEAFQERRRGIAGFVAKLLSGQVQDWTKKAEGKTAGDVMTPLVVTAAPEDDLHAAARLMIDADVKRLPVVDDRRLVGIVSRSDLIRVFTTSDLELRRMIERFLTRCGYDWLPDHRIDVAVNRGSVTLEGSVRYENDIRAVGSLIEALDGVVSVENRLLYREAEGQRIR